MKILGINGWRGRSHDPSVCLLKDGEVEAFVEEERFNRFRHSFHRLPRSAAAFALQQGEIEAFDLDAIAFAWNYPMLATDAVIPREPEVIVRELLPGLEGHQMPPVHFVPHHLAHAHSAFDTLDWECATVVVVDGQGENEATSLWRADPRGLELLRRWSVPQSLGRIFEGAAAALGFGWNQAGKVMGLAAYGDSDVRLDDLVVNPEFGYSIKGVGKDLSLASTPVGDLWAPMQSLWKSRLSYVYGIEAAESDDGKLQAALRTSTDLAVLAPFARLAAAVQNSITDAVCSLVNLGIRLTGIPDVCLSGGLALNCVANGAVRALSNVARLSIQPWCNDVGGAIGAAAAVQRHLGGTRPRPPHSPFLGPRVDQVKAENLVRESEYAWLDARSDDDWANRIAAHIANGCVVGLVLGRAEVGPRALGARSILASPASVQTRDRVNAIKGREPWRPLAPSILADHFRRFFCGDPVSDYMLGTHVATDRCRSQAPAVVHVDGTARPHLVRGDVQPRFNRLIEAFRALTGLPLLLNTSFNVDGEPMVLNERDAMETFNRSDLDILVLDELIVSKGRRC